MYAVRYNDRIKVFDSYQYRESIKNIDGRYYDADEKCWIVPLSVKNVSTLQILGATLDDDLRELFSTDAKDDIPAEPTIAPPIKGTLYQHQVRAYNFAIELFGLENKEEVMQNGKYPKE